MSRIIIAGQHLTEMGAGYKTWFDNGWDATTEGLVSTTGIVSPGLGAFSADAKNKGLKRYSFRKELRKYQKNPPLDAAKATIRKFILHHDGVSSSAICWNVLHNERGLSCHYLIDNDGTIYQTLDLAFMGYHAAKYNVDSVGVEFCNRGIMTPATYYDGKADPHFEAAPYSINNHKIRSFDFTDKQYEAFFNLAQALVKLLPNLALEYPRDPTNPSKQAWGCLGPIDGEGNSYPASLFAGFMGHYHCTTRKWDPGPFDFKKWIDKLRGQRVFPVGVPGAILDANGKPAIPEDVGQLAAAVQPYYDANELTAEGGFFPVGPWGVSRLWHGGIHLPAQPGDPVYAPFPGRVIAARTTGSTQIGSNNFVLMRHDLNVAAQQIRVYSLYMHLDESGAKETPEWMKNGVPKPIDPGRSVDGYDEVVDAGALIGHVGTVGPDELNKAQLHFEIFSEKRWFESKPGEDPSPWKLIDGSATGHFCEDEVVDALIDTDKDKRLSRKELTEFYADGADKASLRDYITLHVSEWAPDENWAEDLKAALSNFQKKSPKRRGKPVNLDDDDEDVSINVMVEEQLVPFEWWSDEVAKELKLANNATVYHYHPIRFMEFVNSAFKANDVKSDRDKMIDDNEDVKGEFAAAPPDPEPPSDTHLKLENLVDGWEGDVPPT